MPREFPRSRRVEEQIQRVLSETLRGSVRDPRLRGVMITTVKVSRDLSVAKVFYSKLGADADAAVERAAGLAAAASFLRTLLARELRMRQVPELRFLPDEAFERGVALERLISEAARDDRREADGVGGSASKPNAAEESDPDRGDER